MDGNRVVVGIDLGTQGVRVMAFRPDGILVTSEHTRLTGNYPDLPPGWHQQNPEEWWQAVVSCLQKSSLSWPTGTSVDALCVTSTSGSLVALDRSGQPLYPAIMYNDNRSHSYVAEVQAAGVEIEKKLGYAFNTSFALPKIVWLAREQPEVFSKARYLVSPTDFITGRLGADYNHSDTSNALKTGYDLLADEWPGFIQRDLNIPLERLPQVCLPGKVIGKISNSGARQSGLLKGTPLIAGATDGVAAQIASGALTPGAWNSALGTTLVIKGITENLLVDPQQRIYCHRHPAGWWMPGGASNTGAEWIKVEFSDQDPSMLDQLAEGLVPTRITRYPLARKGERFPFFAPQAQGFCIGEPGSQLEAFAAGLEGLAMLERMAYETLSQIGAQVSENIYITGGGARSDLWSTIRASTLQRTLVRPAIRETAMGAALLAASAVWYGDLSEAARRIVRYDREFEPQVRLHENYQEKYGRFKHEMQLRGYYSSPS
ncbi:MAG: hypothetical protein A2Z16_00880 [Chloroflexi bacterium RBG_16_54_18]|nr:MAG: hypothetical protein A2Z16_00880 [Chloroflexi bacterium RBG_16_54_18]